MNRIKNTLLTLTSQLLLTAALGLLTQQTLHAQTNVNVVNTPTVRIDSRGNEVKIVNSPSAPVPVKGIEEPLRILVPHLPNSNYCVPLPLSTERWSLIEQVAIATNPTKVSNLRLVVSFMIAGGAINNEDMYDIPLNQKGRGQLQLKLYAKGFASVYDAAVGDVIGVSLCYDAVDFGFGSRILLIATGRILPQ